MLGDTDPKIDESEGDFPETDKGCAQYAQQLIDNTKLLRAKVETVKVTPDLFITGAVDLLNEVSTSKVTGEKDRYSHTDLYDFAANVEGAEKIFSLLQPELKKKDEAPSTEIESKFDDIYTLPNNQKKAQAQCPFTEHTRRALQRLLKTLTTTERAEVIALLKEWTAATAQMDAGKSIGRLKIHLCRLKIQGQQTAGWL